MSVRISYETHSISTDNEAGVATGWLPGRLSDAGRLLARELGTRYHDSDVAAVYCSDLTRAVETAQLAFGTAGPPVHQDRRLRECDYGTLNGAPVHRVEAERLRRIAEPFPGGQSYLDVVDATEEFLLDLLSGRDGQHILVIAHSANRWALEHLLEGRPLEEAVTAPFGWRPGWRYLLPTGWPGRTGTSGRH